jgi:hypothetical protein
MNASWSIEFRNFMSRNITADVEGGGGGCGPNFGGYDTFGHGTLMYRIDQDG